MPFEFIAILASSFCSSGEFLYRHFIVYRFHFNAVKHRSYGDVLVRCK